MGGKLKTGAKPKQYVASEFVDSGFISTHGFFKWKHSFPKKIVPNDFEEDLISLGYDLDNLPERKSRFVEIDFYRDKLTPILSLKNEDVENFNDYVDLSMWCADIEGSEFSEDVKDSLNYFENLYNKFIFKSRKKEIPIALKLIKKGTRYIRLLLYAEYVENDDDYFSRLKYLSENKT